MSPGRRRSISDPNRPSRLDPLVLAYPALAWDGSLDGDFVVAVVGTRDAAPDALAYTRELAGRIVGAGGVVASGGALGIDAAAHEGALDAGGRTWVIMPSGPGLTTPAGHEELFRRVLDEGGTHVWPFPEGTPALKPWFLSRNYVLTMLADAVVVVQAPIVSGARNTAKHARDTNTPLWVVAAPPWRPEFAGNALEIDRGAKVLTSTDAFLAHFGRATRPLAEPPPPRRRAARAPRASVDRRAPDELDARALFPADVGSRDPDEQALLDVLSSEPRHVDDLALRARLPASRAMAALLALVLDSAANEGPLGFFSKHNPSK